MSKPRVIFILSLGHSGSTLLDLLLGSSPEAVSCGELYDVARGKNARGGDDQGVCGCGLSIKDCPVWSKVKATCLDTNSDKETYCCALKAIAGETNRVIIDSSKRLDAYQAAVALAKAGEIDLKVLFLVRDVRGWTASYVARNKKNNLPKESVVRLMMRWNKHNQQLENSLKQNETEYLAVSYEELIFDTPGTLKKVCDFGGVQIGDGETFADNHVGLGNRTKNNAKKKFEIVYDARWLHDSNINRWFALLWPVQKTNRRYVTLPNYQR